MLDIDRTASVKTPETPEQCLARLADIDGYASWARLISSAEVIDRAAGGRPAIVRLRARVFGLAVELRCELELSSGRAVLRRLDESADDPESYVATWTVRPRDGATTVDLHVRARLEAPGAAMPLRGRIARRLVDELLDDFARAGGS